MGGFSLLFRPCFNHFLYCYKFFICFLLHDTKILSNFARNKLIIHLNDLDYEENFTVIYKTVCPAILTENLFMDNKTDVEFLMSDEGRNKIAQIHVNAIKRLCFY